MIVDKNPAKITRRVNGKDFFPLYPELFRALTDDEAETLRESIQEHGVTNPPIDDGAGGIIDGWNRLNIHADLWPDEPLKIISCPGLTDDEKFEKAASLNAAKGRRLGVEDRQRLVAELKRRGLSNRLIAFRLHVDPKTVRKDLAQSGEDFPSPDGKVIGRDRKSYAPPSAIVLDALGRPVPRELRDVFGSETLPALIAEIEQWAAALRARAPEWMAEAVRIRSTNPYLLVDHFRQDIEKLLSAVESSLDRLRNALPYVPCLKCKGKGIAGSIGCDQCRNGGYLNEATYREQTAEASAA